MIRSIHALRAATSLAFAAPLGVVLTSACSHDSLPTSDLKSVYCNAQTHLCLNPAGCGNNVDEYDSTPITVNAIQVCYDPNFNDSTACDTVCNTGHGLGKVYEWPQNCSSKIDTSPPTLVPPCAEDTATAQAAIVAAQVTDECTLQGAGTATFQSSPATATISTGFLKFSAPNIDCTPATQTSCPAQIDFMQITFDNFTVDKHDISQLSIFNDLPALPASGFIDSGTGLFMFTIPNGVPFAASAFVDGHQTTLSVTSQGNQTGSLDPATGDITLTFDFAGSFDGDDFTAHGTAMSAQIIGVAPTVTAPASVSADATTTCQAAVPLTASATSLLGLPVIIDYLVDGAFAGSAPSGAALPVVLSIGSHAVSITAVDSEGFFAYASQTVTVNDETAPAFGPVASSVTIDGCSNGASPITVTLPSAQDVCSGAPATVTGTVIQYNGAATSIPVVNGTVVVPPGSGVIQFTAQNANGVTSSVEQTLTVLAPPAVFGQQGVAVDNGASVSGALYAGTGGSVVLGNDAVVGSVFSLSPVQLRNRTTATLVDTSATLTQGNDDHVGSVSTSTPTLPSFPTVSVAFTGTQAIQVSPGTTQSLAPGQYGAVTVHPNAKLVLSAGDYELTSLDFAPQAQLVVPSATAEAVQMFVRDSVIYRGSTVASGALAPLYLGYTGTAPLTLERAFLGTIVAPSASLTLKPLNQGNFTGDFFAKTVTLSPHTSVLSQPFICP